jgi:hypothetical protein
MHFIYLKFEFAKYNNGQYNKNVETNRTSINLLLAVSQTTKQNIGLGGEW